MRTSLDHTIHFHRPFRADEWLLFHNVTTASSNSRGVARTEVWTSNGYLAASFMQEALMRPARDWKPIPNPQDELASLAAQTAQLLGGEENVVPPLVMPSCSPLTQVLSLEQIAGCDTFVGHPSQPIASPAPDFKWQSFGGHIAAQCVAAACQTVPSTHRIHSMHSYFILPGDPKKRIVFEVSRMRDGVSFKTRYVLASQENRPIFMMMASFHRQEVGPEFQRTPEELGKTLVAEFGVVRSPSQLLEDGAKLVRTDSTVGLCASTGRNHSLWWVKHATKLPEGATPWVLHAAVLAYMSDIGMVLTVRKPYRDSPIEMEAILDHAIHFHREFRSDEWLLFHYETTTSSGARGVARTEVWQRGQLVASFMQESLQRPARDWAPAVHPYEELAASAVRTVQLLGMEPDPDSKL